MFDLFSTVIWVILTTKTIGEYLNDCLGKLAWVLFCAGNCEPAGKIFSLGMDFYIFTYFNFFFFNKLYAQHGA